MALDTLSETQRRLADAGFVADLTASGKVLHDSKRGVDYEPDALRVMELVRFEGQSDPGDEALLLAVATRDGTPVGTFTTPFGPNASAEEAEIVRHLHRVVATDEETAAHGSHDHIAAILPSREAAEAAIKELREVGLGSEHLGVALRHGDHAVFERDEEVDLGHDVEAGVLGGAGVGVLAGVALFAVAVPGIGLAGVAAIGAATALGGTMLGGYLGVFRASEEFDSHEKLREIALEPDEVLVVACGHHHPDLVEAAMERHGGRLIATAS